VLVSRLGVSRKARGPDTSVVTFDAGGVSGFAALLCSFALWRSHRRLAVTGFVALFGLGSLDSVTEVMNGSASLLRTFYFSADSDAGKNASQLPPAAES
jgi:membrane-associated PAP2 superfamily phosphatase